ncbi:MAG TPA: extracellular solute-binding protein [Chloroflexota bacterium]|nr:extracellular solute-binding protein [Chloroflexota bacterium]
MASKGTPDGGRGAVSHVSRRGLLQLTAGATLPVAVAACARPGSDRSGGGALSEAPVTIAFAARTSKTEDEIQGILGDWNTAHPSWQVHITRGLDDTKLKALVAAGEKMDLLGWYQAARTIILLLNILRPIEDYTKKDRFPVQRYSPKEVELVGRYQGQLYALPYAYGGNATALLYNRSLFREAGVSEPPVDWGTAWTWEQFREVLRKLTKRSGSIITQVGLTQLGDPITSLLVLTDGTWISDDYKKATADRTETIEAFERYAELILKDSTLAASAGADLGSGDAFINGKAAMHVICCGPLAYTNRLQGTGLDWGFAPMPKMKYSSPDFQSVILAVPRLGDHPEHGWELAKYLLEGSRYGMLEQRMPAVVEDAAEWARMSYQEYPQARAQVLADGVKVARPVDKIKYHPASVEMYDLVNPHLRDAWAGKQQVRAMMTSLQPQLQGIIDRFEQSRGGG